MPPSHKAILPVADSEALTSAIHRLALNYHLEEKETEIRRILKCESNNNQEARNYHAAVGVDIGIFQLNSYYKKATFIRCGFLVGVRTSLEYDNSSMKRTASNVAGSN
jgi:hypothetical protein